MSRKTPKKVWIVEGYTGSYSDHVEWIAAAYLKEASARRHTNAANNAVEQFQIDVPDRYTRSDLIRDYLGELDPNARYDEYLRYQTYSVNIRKALPKAK